MSKYDFEPKNYYFDLGIKKGASKDEIKQAYYQLAKENHPDVNTSAPSMAKFKKISQAYEVLFLILYRY